MDHQKNKEFIKNCFIDHNDCIGEYCGHINSNASILTNWLYALSLGGFAAIGWIYSSKIYLPGVLDCFWWFFSSLFFCVLSTAIEWVRFSYFSFKERKEFKRLCNNNFSPESYDGYYKKTTGTDYWSWIVLFLRIVGYVCLLYGAISLWAHIGHV